MSGKKFLQVVLGLAVSAVFLWLIARAVPLDDLKASLATVRPGMILAAIAFFIAGYLCRIRRWHLMLTIDNPELPFVRAGIPFMISIAANNVLPLRAGDVMRAFAFSSWLRVPPSGVLATLVSERLLDLLMLLISLAAALFLLGLSADATAALLGIGSVGLTALAVTVAVVVAFPQIFEPPVMFLLGLPLRRMGRTGERLLAAAGNVFATMRRLVRSGRTAGLFAMSILAWAAEAMVFFCSAQAVPALSNPQAAWLAMPVGTLSTLLPSSPGYLGTFHYFVIGAAELLGNVTASAAAFAVVVHLVLWMTATVIGGACFVVWSTSRVKA